MTDNTPGDKSTYIGEDASKSTEDQSSQPTRSESPPPAKRHRKSAISIPFLLGSTDDSIAGPSNTDNVDTERDFDMSDGRMYRLPSKGKVASHADVSTGNEVRALRVVEIMNDFRTLQLHIESLINRDDATPPDQQSMYLEGYQLLRQCTAEAQAVLATNFNPGNLGLESGRIPDTEVQKATLQRYYTTAMKLALLMPTLEYSSMLQPEGFRRTGSTCAPPPGCVGLRYDGNSWHRANQRQSLLRGCKE